MPPPLTEALRQVNLEIDRLVDEAHLVKAA